MKKLLVLGALLALTACAQELPKTIEQGQVIGTIQKLRAATDVPELIYTEGSDPHQKNWGKAGAYYVTVNGQDYSIIWEHADKFAKLHEGDRVTLIPTEYIVCEGQNDYKPHCGKLMKIYRGESRVNPVQQPIKVEVKH